LAASASFAIETMLTGQSAIKLIRAARVMDYKVNLIYIGLMSVNQSKRRVASRVETGGHDVSVMDIVRRYPRSLDNLVATIPEADRVWIIDNSGKRWRLLVSIEGQRVKSASRDLPNWATRVMQSIS
jgi:predicted ABC-type ATPase